MNHLATHSHPAQTPRSTHHAARRLVKEDDLGAAQEREHDGQLALLATAQRAHRGARLVRHAQRRQPRRALPLDGGGRDALERREEPQVLHHSEVRPQHVVLRAHTEQLAQARLVA